MRCRLFSCLVPLLIGGCGGAGAPAPRGGVATRDVGAAEEGAALAASLPPGANRCSVARPGLVPAQRRGLFLRLSQSDPTAWMPGAPVRTWAVGERVGPDGRRSTVALARVTGDRAAVRAWMETVAPSRVRWDDRPSDDPSALHAYRARFVDAETLRIERGRWPVARGEGPGAEVRCAALARAHPEAVEVASRHGGELVLGLEAHVPRQHDVIVTAGADGVLVTREVHMASAEKAEEHRRDLRGTESFALGMTADLMPTRVDRERRGAVLVTRLHVLWEDLLLAAEDQRRMAVAVAEDRRRSQPRPVEEIDVSSLPVVRQQVELWSHDVEGHAGAARSARVAQLRRLLERAWGVHPTELWLARRLGRLLIDEAEDGRAALEVVEGALATRPRDREEWRVLGREAAAVLGVEALAARLVEDQLLTARDARRAAGDLVALRRRGVAYEMAEGAWIAGDAIARTAPRTRMREVPPADLPAHSLPETLSELASMAMRSSAPAAFYLLVRGDVRDMERCWAPACELGMTLRGPDGAPLLVGAAGVGDGRLRDLGQMLAVAVEPGPAEVHAWVVPLGGDIASPEVALRLGGTMTDEGFTIERAAGVAARLDWQEVERLLADPLLDVDAERVFPPPELELRARSSEEASRFLDLAADHGAVRCTRTELRLRCVSDAESPRAILELLRAHARQHLGPAARQLRR